MEENLPPGFRFHPTDEELITYYLSNKVSNFDFTTRAVAEVDLNKCEPWDLPAKASMGEKEWYFFSLRDRKYPTGLRTNRATEAGYWKTTGKDKDIFRDGSVLVGMKKTLVFYRGRAPKGEKTNWVMHEYRLESKLAFKPIKEAEWVVCRVFQKSTTVKKPPQTPPSPSSQDQSLSDTNTLMVNELGDNISHEFPIPSLQNYNNVNEYHHHHQNNNNMMNWSAANSLPSLMTWPLLNTTNLSSVNSLLLTALQLRGPAPTTTGNNYSNFMPHDQFGSTDQHFGSTSMNNMASSSTVLDSVPSLPPQEQPFDVDSNIW
ncbi:hypothetical protein ACJIZ3_020818 [Penstemon smallii]|uniref:NAC domain-containing protein n=1 Tax=Penstemon smallii TaxID=265156 RepID=A0ABD3SJT0_9LAMI